MRESDLAHCRSSPVKAYTPESITMKRGEFQRVAVSIPWISPSRTGDPKDPFSTRFAAGLEKRASSGQNKGLVSKLMRVTAMRSRTAGSRNLDRKIFNYVIYFTAECESMPSHFFFQSFVLSSHELLLFRLLVKLFCVSSQIRISSSL